MIAQTSLKGNYSGFFKRVQVEIQRIAAHPLGKNELLSNTGEQSSSVGESQPHALTDTDVNLSAHPAPIDQP
jgi:hypothetical protein